MERSKEKFLKIKIMTNQEEAKVDNLIEKLFKQLDKKQQEELLTIIDLINKD